MSPLGRRSIPTQGSGWLRTHEVYLRDPEEVAVCCHRQFERVAVPHEATKLDAGVYNVDFAEEDA